MLLRNTLYKLRTGRTSFRLSVVARVSSSPHPKETPTGALYYSNLVIYINKPFLSNLICYSVYCKTQCTFRRHNNSINITNTINMLHVSALLSHHQAQTSRTTVSSVLSYSFLSYCIGDPFCITNQNYCLYGVRCPLLFVFGGGGLRW